MFHYRLVVWLVALALGLSFASSARAANPYLPAYEYIPDGEPHIYGDRVYVYGSHDTAVSAKYCDTKLRVWSAPLSDLNNWRDEGDSFHSVADAQHADDVPWSDNSLYAPDVTEKGGKYYLYFYVVGAAGGVAVSNTPAGPFTLVSKIVPPAGSPSTFGDNGQYPDPGVLVDDDGSVYLYWGFRLSEMAQINPANMYEILPGTLQTDVIPAAAPFSYFEASSPRKINGRYYLIYANLNILAYATSDSPRGPFTYGGPIIRQANGAPNGNIHGSLVNLNGQWYVFYHRMTNNTLYSRRACAERITINPDGSIPEVLQTSLGFQDSLDPYRETPADIACVLGNGNYVTEEDVHDHPVIKNKSGSVIGYKFFDFGTIAPGQTTQFSTWVRPGQTSGTLELWLDSTTAGTGVLIGSLAITSPQPADSVWRRLSATVSNVSGRHAVYFKFTAADTTSIICDLKSFAFQKPFAGTRGVRTLTVDDATGVSSVNAGANWSDGLAPGDFADYATGAHGLRTPAGTSADFTFGGHSLFIGAGGRLLLCGNNGGALTVGSFTLSGGQIAQNTASVALTLQAAAGVVSADSTLDAIDTGRSLIIDAPLSGAGRLSIASSTGTGGAVRVTGNNSAYSGDWLVSAAATLQAGGRAPGVLGTGRVLNSGKVVFDRIGALLYDGVISGTGGLASTGAATVTLTGNHTYTGATQLTAGALWVNGSLAATPVSVGAGATLGGTGLLAGPVTVNGTLSPGAGGIGALTCGGSVTFAATGAALFEINSAATPRNDTLSAAGALTVAGTLTVTNLGPALVAGDRFVLFNKAPTGKFNSLVLPALASGLAWKNNLSLDGSLSVVNSTRFVTVTLSPAADTRILNIANDPQSGADQLVGVYKGRDRTLVRFDLSSIPAGSEVFAATLTLYASTSYPKNVSGNPMQLFRVTKPWTEMGARWATYDGVTSWTQRGGDAVGTDGSQLVNPYAISTQNPAGNEPMTWDATDLFQTWVKNGLPNHGLMIVQGGLQDSVLHFWSREYTTASLRPSLSLTYVPVVPASQPSPADAAVGVALTPTLSWLAGADANAHRLYFGLSAAAVAAATPGSPEFRGELAYTQFAPGTLAENTTYYWRVDEIVPSWSAAGTTWRFTTLATPYGQWTLARGLTPGVNDAPAADPDRDGLPNLLEYALGGDPLVADPGRQPAVAVEGGNLVLRFERVDGAEADTTQSVLYGPSLDATAAWSELPVGAASSTSGGASVTITENGTAPDQVTVSLPMQGSTTLFCRLKIGRR